MWEKYCKWRQYQLPLTGLVDTWIFAVVLWFVGVFGLNQDPAGAFLFCMGGIGILMAIPIAGIYSALVSTWVDESPYTANQIADWKQTSHTVLWGESKGLLWRDLRKHVLVLKRACPGIDDVYAHCVIIWAYEQLFSDKWLPDEADDYRRQFPKIWNIVNSVKC